MEASNRLKEIKNVFEEKLNQGYSISQNVSEQLSLSQNVLYNIKKYREFGK
jgi:hypothetical protein